MNHRIAVFTNGYSPEFVEHVLTGLKKKATTDGIDIFTFVSFCTVHDNELQNKSQLNIFKLPNPKDFDGAIMLTNTFNLSEEQQICANFQNENIPMISLEGDVPNISCIKTENYNGMYDLVLHLVECHDVKNIIYINGAKGHAENAIRRKAVLDVLESKGLQLMEELDCDYSFFNPYSQLRQRLAKGMVLPDAFVCANDTMALGTTTALSNAGYTIPDDVIVTGFDHSSEGRYTFPLLASVSRDWENFGELAYDKLMYQIEHPDERFTETYESHFIPSESCGCCPTPENLQYRHNRIHNLYFENIKSDMSTIFFQRLQLAICNAERKEQFFEYGQRVLNDPIIAGDNYCICTEPSFFEIDDIDYTKRVQCFSETMDILYETRNGESIPFHTFSSKELYPGYSHVEGESNHYIFAPFYHMNYLIGYVAIKNNETRLYKQTLSTWINNMNALLFNMRRYVFAQRNNRRLQEIYMTDALTGFYNRTGCETILYEFIKSQKYSNKTTILAFADIDRMKTINDVYGHLNGDLAIKATADAFRKYTPDGWLFGRYGGDEFIAVGLCDNTDTINDDITTISEQMTEYFKTLNLSFLLHASIGYTIITPENNGSINDYIKLADESMYQKKKKCMNF